MKKILYVIMSWDHGDLWLENIAFWDREKADAYVKDRYGYFVDEVEIQDEPV